MVDILQAEGISRYYHAAWADDADGTNFSLTEYDGAVMIGTYNDDSGTESTDPADYTWQIIGAAESDGDGDPATAAAENEINALTAAVDDLTARTLTNAGNIDTVNDVSITGIGQPNLLSGTNRGADGWTGSGFTLAAETGTVYNETDTPITWLKATCVTPGALSFTADGLRAVLADDSDTDTYTLSCDLRMSALSAVNVSMSDADGTNTQIDFGTADNASEILDDLHDMAGTWVHHSLTAQIVDGNTESAQVLLFDCSNMTAGDTIEIANLKIEGGAIATPWKASADEAMNAANEALSIAGNTNQYFWHTETGTDTGAHITEIPKDDFIADPTNGGGNLLARSNGIAVRDGLTELATFGASGISFYNIEDGNRHKTFSINRTGVVIYTETTEESAEITTAVSPVTYVLSHKPTTAQGHNSFGFACPSGGNPVYFTNTGNPITYQWEYLGVSGGTIEYDGDVTCVITPPSSLGTDSVTALFYYEYEIVAPSYDVGTRDSTAGKYSAVIGEGLQAIGDNSVAVGKYNNDPYGGMLFSVGNGTDDNARSNALTVDLSGNLTAAGDITDGGGNVLSNKLDVSTLEDYVTEQDTSGSWRYRKWHSGRVEAWYNSTLTGTATSAAGSLYRRTLSGSIPPGIFTTAPHVLATLGTSSNYMVGVNVSATSPTALEGYGFRTTSSSSAGNVNVALYAWQNP